MPFDDARWFRGRDTTKRTKSACPDPSCCQRPPARLAARWDGMAWPSARAHSHILLALPSGSFPGVEQAFAIQAGREVRILVRAKDTTDASAAKVCYDIAKAFEEQLTYPGEIKVTVLRESRFTEVAK